MTQHMPIMLKATVHDGKVCPYCTIIDLGNALLELGAAPSGVLEGLVLAVAATVAQGSPTTAAREENLATVLADLPGHVQTAVEALAPDATSHRAH